MSWKGVNNKMVKLTTPLNILYYHMFYLQICLAKPVCRFINKMAQLGGLKAQKLEFLSLLFKNLDFFFLIISSVCVCAYALKEMMQSATLRAIKIYK